MAERIGRVGRGGGDWGTGREAAAGRDSRGDRPRGRGLTGLLAMAASGFVLYLAWEVLWERSHPAASAARGLRLRDATGRLEAIRELGGLGAQDPDVALPALIDALADGDALNRATAAECLAGVSQGFGSNGPEPEQVREALSALMARLADPDAMVRIRAAQAICTVAWTWQGSPRAMDLDALGAAMSRMIADADAEVRAVAVQGLAALALRASEGPPSRVLAALEDPSERVREAAAHGLAPFHRELSAMLPTLVLAAERTRPECRPTYLDVLRRFRPSEYPEEVAGEMIRALVVALGSPDCEVRCQVAAMLGEFGPAAREAIPPLLGVLDDPGTPGLSGPGNTGYAADRDPAVAASEALRRVAGDRWQAPPWRQPTPAPVEVAAALLRLQGSPEAGRRLAAVHALTSFEPDDAIVAGLIAASRDADEWVRAAALQALQGRGSRLRIRALAVIRDALEDRSPLVRNAAAHALCGFGSGIEALVPALIRHAEVDPHPWVRQTGAEALGLIVAADVTAAVVPMYREAIARPGTSDRLRRNLIRGLTPFGPAAREAIPAIIGALRSATPSARPQAAPRVILPVGYGEAPPTPEGERIALRREAADALGRLAPGTPRAVEAIAALASALDDPADEVNQHIGEALVAFGPAARAAAPEMVRDMHRAREEGDLMRAGRIAEIIGRTVPDGPGAAEAIAFLIDALRSDDLLQRVFAERILALYGPAAAAALPALLERAGRPMIAGGQEMAPIAVALGRIAPGAPDSDPALATLLRWLSAEPTPSGIEKVIEAIARFGPAAAAATPRLHELARSADPAVASAARKATAILPPSANATADGGTAGVTR